MPGSQLCVFSVHFVFFFGRQANSPFFSLATFLHDARSDKVGHIIWVAKLHQAQIQKERCRGLEGLLRPVVLDGLFQQGRVFRAEEFLNQRFGC